MDSKMGPWLKLCGKYCYGLVVQSRSRIYGSIPCYYRYTDSLDGSNPACLTEKNIEIGTQHALNNRRTAKTPSAALLCSYQYLVWQ
jgi:hypothetical protein